ncbi:MAG TPA: aminotransferase class I/II-fold pyridoxal phosphate-dependent enzyme [Jatrophihabitans sp.]|uniref:DegT/DnrJ/EryC1/StrS family aminotransferase n=1 Tax=Jatrophihabitans sp. TaxID=1932789 RepID=UPI002EDE6108
MTINEDLIANPFDLAGSDDTPLAIDGGAPVRSTPWPTYDKGAVCVCPEDEDAAIRAIRSHLFFRYDYRPYSQTECGQFERELCDYFGVQHSLAVTSGTAALALAIMAAGIAPGSLIACPGFTFVATPSAILMAGCRPLLVEVTKDLHMDLDDLRRRWTPEVKAIMVVHMRGFAADVEALSDFADEMGVPLFEDAVPALGVELKGRKLGTFGLAGGFSTQSDKSLNSGEGGFLVTDDSALHARAVVLAGAYEGRVGRHFGDRPPPLDTDLSLPLLSLRMDEIRAALLRSELVRLPDRLACFHRNYDYVATALADVKGIDIRQPVAPDAYLGEAFIFRVPGGRTPGGAAQWFADALCAEGIDARNLGSSRDANVRAFWNWRFLFGAAGVPEIQAQLPVTTGYLQDSVDVALSSTLRAEDCDHLITAVRRIARTLRQQRSDGSAERPVR